MRRNLRIDILMMLLFIIFGGVPLDAQQTSRKGKDGNGGGEVKSPIFSDIESKGNGGGNCSSEDRNGQFCFSQRVNFVNLEFEDEINAETGIREAILPCDLHVGASIEGLEEITFISLSDNEHYEFHEATDDYEAFYKGSIGICFDASIIYNLINYNPKAECDSPRPIGDISISFDLYCNSLNGMTQVDNCDSDFDFLEDYTYGGDTYDDCSFEIIQNFNICCNENKKSKEIKIRISYKGSELNVEGSELNDVHYKIYSINGDLKSSGILDNANRKHTTIQNQYLENGIYILVLTSEETQSSHKFVSFR